jgi:hypothetical protein
MPVRPRALCAVPAPPRPSPPAARRGLAAGAALLVLAALAACAPRVDPIPAAALDQPPPAPLLSPWLARGRLDLRLPFGRRFGCGALVRSYGDGRVRTVLLSDEGLMIADLWLCAGQATVVQALPALTRALPYLEDLLIAGFAPAPTTASQHRDGCIVERCGDAWRWFGGDPVLARASQGRYLTCSFEDYRAFAPALVARTLRGAGPLGMRLVLRLDTIAAYGGAPGSTPRPVSVPDSGAPRPPAGGVSAPRR